MQDIPLCREHPLPGSSGVLHYNMLPWLQRYVVVSSFFMLLCSLISVFKYQKSFVSNTRVALPFLHHTELLLSPTFVYAILWFTSLFGFNIPKHIAPLLVLGAR